MGQFAGQFGQPLSGANFGASLDGQLWTATFGADGGKHATRSASVACLVRVLGSHSGGGSHCGAVALWTPTIGTSVLAGSGTESGAGEDQRLRVPATLKLGDGHETLLEPPLSSSREITFMRTLIPAVFTILCVATMSNCASSNAPDRIGFEEARAMFAGRGVQPGQALPALRVVDLHGQPVAIRDLHAGRPLVLITASLTCNVARRQQSDVDALRTRFGDRVAVAVVYTIDAHPKGDPCPYTGKEWVPKDNERDDVLVRQPTTIEERLIVARDYQRRFSSNATVVVDSMDDAGWHALGQAPNLGLLVDRDGIVRLRQGWFDPPAMNEAVAAMLGD